MFSSFGATYRPSFVRRRSDRSSVSPSTDVNTRHSLSTTATTTTTTTIISGQNDHERRLLVANNHLASLETFCNHLRIFHWAQTTATEEESSTPAAIGGGNIDDDIILAFLASH
jgi:hypothetical protein